MLDTRRQYAIYCIYQTDRGDLLNLRTALITLTAALSAASLSAGCTGTAAASPRPADKPTVVLVHGAFADSSSWNGVIKQLEADGYPVIAAANPLRGLAFDAAYVRSVVDSAKSHTVEIDASHAVTVSRPDAVADLIDQSAIATNS